MEAVRQKKSKTSSRSQDRKQRQSGGVKSATARSAGCDEEAGAATPPSSEFTDVPLSLPYEGTEQQQGLAGASETLSETSQPSTQILPQTSEESLPASQTLSSSTLSQTSLTLSSTSPQTLAKPSEAEPEKRDEGRGEAQGAELRAQPQSTEVGRETQNKTHIQTQPCISTKLKIPLAPSAPALYPLLPTLEEGSLMQLHEEALRACGTRGPAVLPLGEQECPPSLEPVVEVAPSEGSRTRLYPELPQPSPELQAFSLEQLSVWEPGGGMCVWVEGVELCAARFAVLARQEGHELTDLLQNYWRCRRQLTHAHTQLHTQTSDCNTTQNRLWSFRDEQLTLQGVCGDQSKVYGYHRFQQADFSEAVLVELRKLFEARTELLHQKESISVLFSFTRRVLDDTQFQTDIHLWLQRLVAVLLRVGGSGEHLYMLNHLLCCSAGVGKWAATFLQIQVLGNPSGVQQFMQALAILMSPVRHRAEFMSHMKPCESQSAAASGPESGNWTLVDEGGEEDEDPESSWLLLCVYEPKACSSQKMMRVFAFASSLIELLAVGLHTYNRARYRQLVKRIGHTIRMTVCYVSDHWAQYVSVAGPARPSTISLEKLQLEYDHLFLRAVLHVLRNKRLGIWLFMSEMPYGTLSSSMLWRILYVMQCAETAAPDTLNSTDNTYTCLQALREPSHQERFEKWLCEVNSSDGISLLTALAHMAMPTHHSDPTFITTIALLVFQVSYVSVSTRETYSKVGRELLAAIATAHPYIISVLLDRLRETIETVGMVALYLCKELPLFLWRPSPEEKYLTDKPYNGLISEGIKQVSYLASVLRLGLSPEASFSQWAWQLLLRLKLHGNTQYPQAAWSTSGSAPNPSPELTHTPNMHPVLRAVFCTEGVDLLRSLIQSQHLRAAVHLLDNILPPTYPLSFYLLKNTQFVGCVQLFLQCDGVCPQGVTQQVTHRVAPLFTGGTYGDMVRLLNSVIQTHVVESSRPGRVGPAAVLEFWVGILTQQNLWYRDRTVLFLMDQICRAAFTHHQEECVQRLLYQQHKIALGYHGDRGLLSSLVGWIAGNATPSFIEGLSMSGEVWFAWLVLNMEGMFEEDSQLRRCVEHELLSDPNMSPDQALKKAQQRLKLPVAPSLQRLQVYRWACQALATPPDHPLLPLVWQSLDAGGCIGRRFFQSSSQAVLLRDLRQRLQEVSDFHHAASQALRVPPPHTPSQGEDRPDSPPPLFLTSPHLHTELVRLFGVFAVWLDDETLQKKEVYLPSLPPQYDPHRLAKVMHKQQELWVEYVDQERVQYDEREVLDLWEKVKNEPTFIQSNNPAFTDYTNPRAARKRIQSNLQKHAIPRPLPELQSQRAPVPDVPSACLTDPAAASTLLQQDLSCLQEQARFAVSREAQQVALESELLESLPLLYRNRPEQVTMALECRGQRGGQPCQGAAHITVTSLAQAAVHTENFITALVNLYKAKPTAAVQNVGVAAFYKVVSFVSPNQLVSLYKEVVTSLHPDSADVIFMLLTKRSRLVELVHTALCSCGRDPEADLLTPFHLFTRHWTLLLKHHFPDHYSDCLRLLMTSSTEQLLSPECWRVTLCVLGISPAPCNTKTTAEPSGTADTPKPTSTSPSQAPITLSPQQVEETVDWLCEYFQRCRLSKSDLRSFGLYSAWAPYVSEVTTFWGYLIGYLIDLQLSACAREPLGGARVLKALQDLHSKMVRLFKPWILVLETDDVSAARCLVGLYTQLTQTLHYKFRDRLLPGQRGVLWLCLMQYCDSCSSPCTPEYLLYLYHTHLRSLPWTHLHPDTHLMEQLFNVERGSPKSCFLFLGAVLCEVNWVSVLSDSLQTPASSNRNIHTDSHKMLVYLLYMLVFLTKEEQLLSQPDSPLLSLLVQSASLPWHQVDHSSYQGIMGYVGTHYPHALLLSTDSAPQTLLQSLRSAAGLQPRPHGTPYQEETLKAGVCVHWCVQCLVSLEQSGSISLANLETQLETLLDSIITFNPPEVGLEQRHMAFCSLFCDSLALLNGVGVSTAEALAARVIGWLDRKGQGFPVLPLLTACSRCLASVRHMTRITEACITAYFTHAEEEGVGWGPVLASLQVPELTVDDFLSESQSGGSFLTLYAYILQRLNTEHTAANEKRTLALLNTWTSQVFPSGPYDEAKLFLWWHKALCVSVEHLQQGLGEVPAVIPSEDQSMPSSKQYADLKDSIGKAVQFIHYPGHCLRDGPRLLSLLANLLYPDHRYLNIIR
ncbi:unnamed protein product [Coregonus sp. 'balchen']|nr:unnamed protein product [Coregonus sp. 'balchen']